MIGYFPYILGWSGPSLLHLNHTLFPQETDFTITSNQASWIGSLMPVGALFGGMPLKYLYIFLSTFHRSNSFLMIWSVINQVIK